MIQSLKSQDQKKSVEEDVELGLLGSAMGEVNCEAVPDGAEIDEENSQEIRRLQKKTKALKELRAKCQEEEAVLMQLQTKAKPFDEEAGTSGLVGQRKPVGGDSKFSRPQSISREKDSVQNDDKSPGIEHQKPVEKGNEKPQSEEMMWNEEPVAVMSEEEADNEDREREENQDPKLKVIEDMWEFTTPQSSHTLLSWLKSKLWTRISAQEFNVFETPHPAILYYLSQLKDCIYSMHSGLPINRYKYGHCHLTLIGMRIFDGLGDLPCLAEKLWGLRHRIFTICLLGTRFRSS